MEKERKVFKTLYEYLMIGWIVLGAVLIASLIAVSVAVTVTNPEGPETEDILLLFGVLAVGIVILLIYAAILGVAEKKMAHTYLYWKGEEICVNMKLYSFSPVGGGKIKGPVVISEKGIAWANQFFSWEILEGKVCYRENTAGGNRIWYIMFQTADNRTGLYSLQNLKNYFLFKRFCPIPIEGIQKLDGMYAKYFDQKMEKDAPMPEKVASNEGETIVENALPQNSNATFAKPDKSSKKVYFFALRWLWTLLLVVVNIAFFSCIIIVLVSADAVAAAGGLGTVGTVVVIVGFNYIWKHFPKGVTSIDDKWICNACITSETKIPVAEADVIEKKMFIEFVCGVDKIKIFNTQKARDLIRKLPFKKY